MWDFPAVSVCPDVAPRAGGYSGQWCVLWPIAPQIDILLEQAENTAQDCCSAFFSGQEELGHLLLTSPFAKPMALIAET